MRFRFYSFLVCHLVIVSAYSQPKKSKKIQRIIDEATKGRHAGVVIYVKTPEDGDRKAASG
jgi:hypothetical protein